MKSQYCCFTGHRVIPEKDYRMVLENTRTEIEKLIKSGVSNFIAGGAVGFDTLCAWLVLEFKKTYPHVRLHLALPCEKQAKNWSDEEIWQYNKILDASDTITYVSYNYSKGCMYKRNRYMVDNSSYCIFYCTKQHGGSFFTVNYARAQNLSLISVIF